MATARLRRASPTQSGKPGSPPVRRFHSGVLPEKDQPTVPRVGTGAISPTALRGSQVCGVSQSEKKRAGSCFESGGWRIPPPGGAAFAKAYSSILRVSEEKPAGRGRGSAGEIKRRKNFTAEAQSSQSGGRKMRKTWWGLAKTRLRLARCRRENARRGESRGLMAAPARLTFHSLYTSFAGSSSFHLQRLECAE